MQIHKLSLCSHTVHEGRSECCIYVMQTIKILQDLDHVAPCLLVFLCKGGQDISVV